MPRRPHYAFWIFLGINAAIYLCILAVGSILTIGDKLARVHPYFAYGFYFFTAVGAFFFLLLPTLRIWRAPTLHPSDYRVAQGSGDKIAVEQNRKVAQRLLRSGNLSDEQRARLSVALRQGQNLAPILTAIIAERTKLLEETTRKYATITFVATALSQNGRLDGLFVVINSIRMVNEMVDAFGYRPTMVQLLRLYSSIFLAAVMAGSIEDLDIESFIAGISVNVLSKPISAILAAFAQGAGNAFITLRIGYLTAAYLTMPAQEFHTRETRRKAWRRAATALPGVLVGAMKLIPGTFSSIFSRL